MRNRLVVIFIFLVHSFLSTAQVIDNAALYRNMLSDKSIRLHYENDYFSASDLYYTQGINLEIIHPNLRNFILAKLLVSLPRTTQKFGIAAEYLGYTPSSISSDDILYGDRPFASSLMVKSFSISNDSSSGIRLNSNFSLGIIGPLAGGKEFQSLIHKWINDEQPRGWQHQIQNDLVINYNIGIAKSLVDFDNISVAGKVSVDLGTMKTNARCGLIFLAGFFENPWLNFSQSHRKIQIYMYDEPYAQITGYDATLQGGMFNRKSPYTIRASDVTRFVFQNNAGLVMKFNNLYLEYFQTYITKEFRTGNSHQWGGVRVGLTL